jgi:hypothetical protein
MATLPGLPMFGHGQIEGFSEKYGMEFRRAYWDEQIDPYLVERHQREIFPLLHRRALFAGVEHFLLYDFFTNAGGVNEDVYAYSNGLGSERALVVFHNRFADASGWVRNSVGFSVKTGSGDQRSITQRTLSEGLGIEPGANSFVIFRDQTSRLEFIRPANDMIHQGLYLELRAYQTHVFMDFRQVQDDAWQSYRHLYTYLNGRGVPDIQEAMRELVVQPVREPFRQLANPAYWQYLKSQVVRKDQPEVAEAVIEEAAQKINNLMAGMQYLNPALQPDPAVVLGVQQTLRALLSLPLFEQIHPFPGSKKYPKAIEYTLPLFEEQSEVWPVWFTWTFLSNLDALSPTKNGSHQVISWMDEWQFNKVLVDGLQSNGLTDTAANRLASLLRVLIKQKNWYSEMGSRPLVFILESWLSVDEIRSFLNINRYKEVLWFNQEAFDEFLWWMMVLALFEIAGDETSSSALLIENILGAHDIVQRLLKAEKASEFQLNLLLGLVTKPEK